MSTKHFLLFIVFGFVVLISNSCAKKTITSSDIPPKLTNHGVVKIDETVIGFGPCEPSICISPTNTKSIVAGAVLNFVYTSADGGVTWAKQRLKSSLGVYGDPVVRADSQGNFFYAHLSDPSGKGWLDIGFLDRIVIQKSTDGGENWSDGSFTKPNSPKDQDKHWLAINPKTNEIYMTWTEFDKYESDDPNDKSRILFSRSLDNGTSWSDGVSISQYEGNCLDNDDTTEGATPAVGLNGEIYVSWAYNNKLYFDKSIDEGNTWLAEDIVLASQPQGWAFDVPGLTRCNGMPVTKVDLSKGPQQGTIYVNWSDQLNGESDTDIWIKKSMDGGLTWSERIRVNQDETKTHQFFTWMDIDPTTGYIYIVYYDRRAYMDTKTDVYLAYSTDGAQSFKEIKLNKEPFTPNPSLFFGDYNDISAINGSIRPIWTEMTQSKTSVWTALLEHH